MKKSETKTATNNGSAAGAASSAAAAAAAAAEAAAAEPTKAELEAEFDPNDKGKWKFLAQRTLKGAGAVVVHHLIKECTLEL